MSLVLDDLSEFLRTIARHAETPGVCDEATYFADHLDSTEYHAC